MPSEFRASKLYYYSVSFEFLFPSVHVFVIDKGISNNAGLLATQHFVQIQDEHIACLHIACQILHATDGI